MRWRFVAYALLGAVVRGDPRAMARRRARRVRARRGRLAQARRRRSLVSPFAALALRRGERRHVRLARVGGIQGRRALVRRRLRDHPADAGRRRRALRLDDRHGVPERGRARAGHARPGRAHGRGRRLCGRGIPGALLAAVVAFAPSFAFVLVGAQRFDRLVANRDVRAFFDGAGPAAIGAILGSAIPLALALQETWQWAVLAGAARLRCSCCGAGSSSRCSAAGAVGAVARRARSSARAAR